MSVMRHDAYGLPVTTSCVSALESYARGVEGLLGWRADALARPRGGARAPRRRQARRRRARDARAPRRAPARPRDPAAPVLRLVLTGAVPGGARGHDGRGAPP